MLTPSSVDQVASLIPTALWNDRYVVPAPLTEVVPILEVALTLLEVALILLELVLIHFEVVPTEAEVKQRTILTDVAAPPIRTVSTWRPPCQTTSRPSVRALSALRDAGNGED